MEEKLRIGVVGLGMRGPSVMMNTVVPREDSEVVAVCDLYTDKVTAAADSVEQATGKRPRESTDYKDLTRAEDIDIILVLGAWDCHIPVAIDAMRHGKPAGIEVGGAYTLNDCFRLVETYEDTGIPCMMLENCCYGRTELMILNMVRQGIFGDIVHCEGGYHHDLRSSLAHSVEKHRYRAMQYVHRCGENYPTHELGPIMNILNINRGNRLLTLSSFASCAKGMAQYVADDPTSDENLKNANWRHGDVITTVLRTANGETITLTLDTTLPRAYSRGFTVQGTKGMYSEDNRSVFLDKQDTALEAGGKWVNAWNNEEKYLEQYEHPIWHRFLTDGVRGGHGGMDWLVMDAFLRAIKEGHELPIDIYDTATLLAITPLSEDSIAQGGLPVSIPDFTRGLWVNRTCETWDYSL